MIFDVSEAEAKLGYVFQDKMLLRKAFTHASYINENPGSESNEILEFFGDSILGFVVKEHLFRRFPEKHEGELTEICQHILSSEPLAQAVLRMRLNDCLLLSVGELKNRENRSICEDLFEASVAAIYLDGGMPAAKRFILGSLAPEIEASLLPRPKKPRAEAKPKPEPKRAAKPKEPKPLRAKAEGEAPAKKRVPAPKPASKSASKPTTKSAPKPVSKPEPEADKPAAEAKPKRRAAAKKSSPAAPAAAPAEKPVPVPVPVRNAEPAAPAVPEKDAKSQLSETLQKQGRKHEYKVLSCTGPDHDPTFEVRLEIDGRPVSTGSGKSKKLAETQAAERALTNL